MDVKKGEDRGKEKKQGEIIGNSFLEYSGISKQGRGILEKTERVGGNGSNRDMGRRKELEKSQRKIAKRV